MSSPVSTEIGDDLCWVYHPSIYPGHSAWPSSVGRYNEYQGWFQHSLGRNGASEVTTRDVKIGFFFQKSIIVSLKSIFYRLSWRHYCSSTNTVLHVMPGRRVSGALILKLIVMLLENMFLWLFSSSMLCVSILIFQCLYLYRLREQREVFCFIEKQTWEVATSIADFKVVRCPQLRTWLNQHGCLPMASLQ